MIRNWLRAWLGIDEICEAQHTNWVGLDRRISEQQQLTTELNKLHGELNAALQEMRQLRELVQDPKKIPVQTRNSRQFRALVEQDL